VARKRIVDPLPRAVLHSLVLDLPGPKGETELQRAVRFETQLTELHSHDPRNAAEAMIAAQCILLRLLTEDFYRDANCPNLDPISEKKLRHGAKQMDKLLADMKTSLARLQARPAGGPAMFLSLCLTDVPITDLDDPDPAEQAFSAIIVPLHPAPKMPR
jgi:hypothetical protein